jgi:hypothetical protein
MRIPGRIEGWWRGWGWGRTHIFCVIRRTPFAILILCTARSRGWMQPQENPGGSMESKLAWGDSISNPFPRSLGYPSPLPPPSNPPCTLCKGRIITFVMHTWTIQFFNICPVQRCTLTISSRQNTLKISAIVIFFSSLKQLQGPRRPLTEFCLFFLYRSLRKHCYKIEIIFPFFYEND